MRLKENVEILKRINAEIKRRYDNNRLLRYNAGEKVHVKQLRFHKCLKRNRWVFGGNRTGKTECGAAEVVWMLRGNHPYRQNRENAKGWSVSLSRSVQREVAQEKILSYLNPDWIDEIVMESGKADKPKSGIIDRISVRNVFGGVSTLCFKSCEMGREKFQGASLDFVWFDEEPPEDVYDECLMRVLDRKGDVIGTMTPLKGQTFIYDRIFLNEADDPEVWYETMSWNDNPFLDEDEIKRLSFSLEDETLRSRKEGQFACSSGLVYPEFDFAVHVVEPFEIPYHWQDKISIDPGLNNPTSCHWYACDGDGNVFVTAEHYEAGKDIAYHCAQIKRISESLNWRRDFSGGLTALIDSAANQKTLAAEKSVAQLFYENGINVFSGVDKNLFAGISLVKKYLSGESGRPKLFIFSCCKNLIREIKAYRWGGGDVPVKKDDHALDELRYYLMSRPKSAAEAKTEKSEQLKFKERLLLKRRRK